MSIKPPAPAPAQPRHALSRSKRLAFAVIQVTVMYLALELIIFVILAAFNWQLHWMGTFQHERAHLRQKLENRPSVVLRVHPYVGYTEIPPVTVGDDSEGKLCDYPVTEFGYGGQGSPLQTRAPNKVIVAVMGGSVAWSFYLHGTHRLEAALRKDLAFAGKEIVFVNLAVSGYKQPQQLMTLNYIHVLGGQFDIVVNIDGFNDAALYEAENAAHHVFPAFPRGWNTRIATTGPRIARYLGRFEHQIERREDLSRGYSRAPWRYSPLCNLVWWIADSQAEIRMNTLQVEYRGAAPTARSYAEEGPGWTFATPEDLHRHLAALWRNSSVQLDRICAGNGIRYYHFLQPNLLLSGAKPLTAGERHMKAHRDAMYRPGVNGVYPLLIEAGRELKAKGERFTDLTAMFDGHAEPIYVDICHFLQAGNDVLADRVAEAIIDDVRHVALRP